jgi:hypothetical protein
LLRIYEKNFNPKKLKNKKLFGCPNFSLKLQILITLICRSKNYEICTHAKLMVRRIFTKSFKKNLKIM